MMRYVGFRLDAGPMIGIGHLERCITIANALTKFDYECDFFCVESEYPVEERIREAGYTCLLIPRLDGRNRADTRSFLLSDRSLDCIEKNRSHYDLFFVDHYDIDEKWEIELRKRVSISKLIVIDDLADRKHSCDVLIDSAIGRKKDHYAGLVPAYCELLLGSSFYPFREEFFVTRPCQYRIKKSSVDRILVSFGGSDPKNLTIRAVLEIRNRRPDIEIVVVISSASASLDKIKKLGEDDSAISVFVDVRDIHNIIIKSDFAIGASGGSAIERCFMGLPSLNVAFAQNQKWLLKELEKNQLCLTCAESNLEETISNILLSNDLINRLQSIHESCIEYFGNQSEEVRSGFNLANFRLRNIQLEDKDILFSWQNEVGARKYFTNPGVPSYKEHEYWFNKSINDPNRKLWIVLHNNEKAGYLRIDKVSEKLPNSFEVSIFISTEYREKGLSKRALKAIQRMPAIGELFAKIDNRNDASKRLFTSAGFVCISEEYYKWSEE